tara:strand:- start:100 stop:315 length:216 start_codon:yes stop_codon:yes gene_type:complete
MKVTKIKAGRYKVVINGIELIINNYECDNKPWGIYELIDGEWEDNWLDVAYRTETKKKTLKVIEHIFGDPR